MQADRDRHGRGTRSPRHRHRMHAEWSPIVEVIRTSPEKKKKRGRLTRKYDDLIPRACVPLRPLIGVIPDLFFWETTRLSVDDQLRPAERIHN